MNDKEIKQFKELQRLYNNEVDRRLKADNYVSDLKMAVLTALKIIDEKHGTKL